RSRHPDRHTGLVPLDGPRLSRRAPGGRGATSVRPQAGREDAAGGRPGRQGGEVMTTNNPAGRRIKAVGLISGGLDSTLAARVLLEQGIEVVGLHSSTGFRMNDHRRALARPDEEPRRMRNEGLRAGADLGIPVEILDAGEEYLKMVLNPKHGYGKRANPCIDCRLFMIH